MNHPRKQDRKKRSYPARDQENQTALLRALELPELEELHHIVAPLLNLPESLAGLWRVLENLPSILDAGRRWDPDFANHFDGIDFWIGMVNQIPKDHSFRSIEILSKVNEGKDDKGHFYISPPFTGIIDSCPVWSVLWFSSGTLPDNMTFSSRADAFRSLQALLLCIHIHLRHHLVAGLPYNSHRISEAGLLLRKIHLPEHGKQLDRWVQSNDIPAAYEFFKKQHESGAKAFRQGYGAFADLLNDVYFLGFDSVFRERELNPSRLRAGTTRKVRGESSWCIYEDHSLYWEAQGNAKRTPREVFKSSLVELEGPGAEEIEAIFEAGALPDEFATPAGLLLQTDDFLDPPENDNNERCLPPLATLYVAARGRYRNEVMRAQVFTTRLSRPHLPLFVRIFRSLQDFLTEPSENQSAKDFELLRETVRLCAVCIATGSTAAEAIHMVEFTTVNKLPDEWKIAYSPIYRVWLRPYPVPVRNPLAETVLANVVTVHPRIALSDVWSVGARLSDAINGCWFRHRASMYEEVFKKVIRPKLLANGVHSDWAQLDALAELMPAWFGGAEEGELLRNSAIFGRDAPQSDIQAHYVALDRKCLDIYYVRMMRDLWLRLSDNGYAANGKLFFQVQTAEIDHSLTGNNWAPTSAHIKALVVKLRERIQHKSAPSLYEHHNLIVAYLGIGLSIATACRDVRTPILDLTLIDQETGFMPMQEKDRSDGSHARLVWIPPMICAAVDSYLTYLRGLWAVLPLDEPLEIVVSATKFRDRQMLGADKFILSLQKTLFFFDRGEVRWLAGEFTGKKLKTLLDGVLPDHWPIPNAGRHHAGTSLFNAEDSFATIIKTLMGHWHIGESAWSPDSAFDPYRYRESIGPIVNSMLEDIDFQAIAF